MRLLQGVDDHAGGEFGVEEGGFLGHEFVGVAEVADGGEGGGLEEEADAVIFAGVGAAEGCDFVGFVGEGPGHFGAGLGEVGGDDAVEDEVLEDGDIELAPRGGFAFKGGVVGEGGEWVVGIGADDDGAVFDGIVDADGVRAEAAFGEVVLEGGEVVAAVPGFEDLAVFFGDVFELFEVEVVEAGGGDDAVRGKDDEAGVLHGDEDEEGEVGGVVVFERCALGGGEFFAVVEAGGVTVVAVGDVEMLVGHHELDVLDDGDVGDGPEFREDDGLAILGGEFCGSEGLAPPTASLDGFEEEVGDVVGFVVVEAEDGGEVGLCGAHQFEAVFLGAGEGLFVGVDGAFSEFFEADAGEEAAAFVGGAGVCVGLLVGVEGGFFVSLEDAGFEPHAQGVGGGFVGGVGAGFLGWDVGEIDGDDIVAIFGEEAGFVFAGEDIVGRGDEGGLVLLGVADCLKGGDVGHVCAPFAGKFGRVIVRERGVGARRVKSSRRDVVKS